MRIDIDKFQTSLRSLELSIEDSKNEIVRLTKRIDDTSNDFVKSIFEESLFQVKLKLNTLQFTYRNFKESILENN